MEDLRFSIDIVLNECSKSLCNIENEELYKTVLKTFINGPLLRFVKSIQNFLIKFKCKNIFMLYVCLSQIQKCLLMYETTILEQNTVINFERILSAYLIKRIQKCFYKLEEYLEMLDLTDLDEHPGIFIDQINIVLNGLNNRENFELIKPHIDKILFQAITIAKISDNIDNLEITSSSKHVLKSIQHFEKKNISETDSFFQFDYLSSSLSILERRINTSILNLIYKIFNDPFCIIKKLIRICRYSINIQLRNSSDLSSMISDLDKSTDALIQIGLFSIACCKNIEYAIPLKSCISSLELLDSDMVPAIIEFYLDPTSKVKKVFLKLLINHWICEICKIQHFLDQIIDPFAYTQTTIDNSMNIIDTICKSDLKSNGDLYEQFLNGLVNFTKYIEKIFTTEISKGNEFSTSYKQFKNASSEYKACLVFNLNTNHDYFDESIKRKLLKRSEIVLKYLQNVQRSICHIMDDKSLSKLEDTNYILSKTKQSSKSFVQDYNLGDNDDLNLLLSSIQVHKSFYNKLERKSSRIFYDQDNCSTDVNGTTYENTIIMDLTNILDNFIETSNINHECETSVKIWEEIDIDTPTRIQDLKDIDNKINGVKKY